MIQISENLIQFLHGIRASPLLSYGNHMNLSRDLIFSMFWCFPVMKCEIMACPKLYKLGASFAHVSLSSSVSSFNDY